MAALADRVDLVNRVSAEDESRAHIYSLLGTLLSSPPSAETLSTVTQFAGGTADFGRAIATLAKMAASTSPVAVHTEYQELFIGLIDDCSICQHTCAMDEAADRPEALTNFRENRADGHGIADIN